MDLLIILSKCLILSLFTVANNELQYWSREIIKEWISKVVVVVFMYGRSHLRLNSWAVIVCLIRLICLSRFNSLLKCNPRYLAELVGNSIMLLM